MSTTPRLLTNDELAALMKSCAGITVEPAALASRPEDPFDGYGLDSLGVLAIVSELEKRHGTRIQADADSCRTPKDFLDTVNASLTTGV